MAMKYYKRHYGTRYRLLNKSRKSRYDAWYNEIRNFIYELDIKLKERPARSPRAHIRSLIAKIGDRDKECPGSNWRIVLQCLLAEKEIVTNERLLYGRLLFNKLRC